MKIRNKILLLLLSFLCSCSFSQDPSPYFFDPEPLPSLEEQKILRELSHKRRTDYIKSHPNLSEEQEALINAGILGEGLTKEQVLLVYDERPDKVEPALKYGSDEMWFYRGVNWNDYLYFKGDILIKIDNSR